MPSEQAFENLNGVTSQKSALPQESLQTTNKGFTDTPTEESNTSTLINGTTNLQSQFDEMDLNGRESDCESGQQWTQVDRSSNGRQSNKRKMKQMNQRDTYPANDNQGYISRGRSFRGSKDHGFAFRVPQAEVAVVKTRSSFHENNLPGSQHVSVKTDRHQGPKLAVSVSMDARESGTHSPTASSPSPSVASSDPHNGGDYRENRWSYRPQGRPMRGRRVFHQNSEANYNTDNTYTSSQHNNTYTGTSVNVDHSAMRAPLVRPTRSPASPPANSYNNSMDEYWKRPMSGGGWRRPFNPRNSGAYNRFNGPTTHTRPYGNQFRYRASVPTMLPETQPESVISPSVEAETDIKPEMTTSTTTATTTTVPISVSTKPDPTTMTEKRTSWAAAVAAFPRNDPTENQSPPCVDSSRAELLTFLLNQWQCFNSITSS